MNLILKLIAGIVAGILVGLYVPLTGVELLYTVKEIIGQLITFTIPLIILFFIASGIAGLPKGSGQNCRFCLWVNDYCWNLSVFISQRHDPIV